MFPAACLSKEKIAHFTRSQTVPSHSPQTDNTNRNRIRVVAESLMQIVHSGEYIICRELEQTRALPVAENVTALLKCRCPNGIRVLHPCFRSHCQPKSLDHMEVHGEAPSGRSPCLRGASVLLAPVDSPKSVFVHHMILVMASNFIIKIRDCGFRWKP